MAQKKFSGRCAVCKSPDRFRIELLKAQATLLLGGDRPWLRGESVGPQALRLQVLKLLSSFERWLGAVHGLDIAKVPL